MGFARQRVMETIGARLVRIDPGQVDQVLVNLAVDLSYALFDPRIRYQK